VTFCGNKTGYYVAFRAPLSDIVSKPPATITSAMLVGFCPPYRNRLQTWRAQRLTVIALVSPEVQHESSPVRATFIPCSVSGNAQPIITSSDDASKFFPLVRRSLITAAPIHRGRVFSKFLLAFPTAVRTADTDNWLLLYFFPSMLFF